MENKLVCAPFLRWTGSKRWFIKDHIDFFIPKEINNYHEPFLGGGSVFFHIKATKEICNRFFLSDSNEELINCYLSIRDDCEKVIFHLKNFINSEKEYYIHRSQKFDTKVERAAKFIYLNRTSFNGIYRVNKYGEYNVPYGKRTNVDVVTSNLIKEVSKTLDGVIINNSHFEDTIYSIKSGDFVFLDPPYTVAHENNGFIEYNQKLFSWEDQILLKEYILKIIDVKANFVLTNACHYSILELYEGIGNICKLSRTSKVGGRNKTRGIYNELVIHNVTK